jgi:hypothetical protein
MPHCACHLTFSQRITYDLRITNSLPLFRSDEATILVSQTDRRFRIPGNRLHDFREDSNKLTYEQALNRHERLLRNRYDSIVTPDA